MTSTHLSESTRKELLAKLKSFHGNSSTDETPAESDEELVLRRILESGRYTTSADVENAVTEYVDGKPLAYITETHIFSALTLTVRPPVYIPRVETEQWVDLLGNLIYKNINTPTSPFSPSKPFRILDICSGSGCIPLLLAHHGHGLIHTIGLEVDDKALDVARENITRNGLDRVSRFEKFDLFDDSQEARDDLINRLTENGRSDFDMIVSNPPYVSSADLKKVEKTWHEGKFALQGKLRAGSSNSWKGKGVEGVDDGEVEEEAVEDDGYSFYRRIKGVYEGFLTKGRVPSLPKLVLEVGATQSQPVQEMYASEGRLVIQKETKRRKEIGAPKLEDGDQVGTERSIWVYRGGT